MKPFSMHVITLMYWWSRSLRWYPLNLLITRFVGRLSSFAATFLDISSIMMNLDPMIQKDMNDYNISEKYIIIFFQILKVLETTSRLHHSYCLGATLKSNDSIWSNDFKANLFSGKKWSKWNFKLCKNVWIYIITFILTWTRGKSRWYICIFFFFFWRSG